MQSHPLDVAQQQLTESLNICLVLLLEYNRAAIHVSVDLTYHTLHLRNRTLLLLAQLLNNFLRVDVIVRDKL